jgi:hypothetical protein
MRLRAQMPRGTGDVPAFLAARANLPPAECARIWKRATDSLAESRADATQTPKGDELGALKELSRLVAQATRRD